MLEVSGVFREFNINFEGSIFKIKIYGRALKGTFSASGSEGSLEEDSKFQVQN